MDRPNEARPGYGSTKRILLVLPQGSTVFHCRLISREARRAGLLLWHGGSSCWMQTHGLGAPFTCSLVVLPLWSACILANLLLFVHLLPPFR